MPQFGSVRLTVVSAAVGLALIGALALLLRRRRRRTATLYHNIYLESSARKDAVGSGKVELGDGDRLRKKNARLTSSNGGIFADSGPVAPTPLKFKCHLNIDLSGT